MKYYELTQVWNCIDQQTIKQLNALQRPESIRKRRPEQPIVTFIAWLKVARHRIANWWKGRVDVPKTLDDISIGQVLLLSSTTDTTLAFKELLGMEDAQIALLDVEEAVGFLNFVRAELERINKRLATAKAEPTPEEKAAGVGQIGSEVGTFGTIDYIAKRMGITHDAAADMNWRRVEAMMLLDRDNELFRRRLQEQYRHNNQ